MQRDYEAWMNSDAVKQSSSALCHHANYGTALKVAKLKQGGQIQQHDANIITSAICHHCRQHRNWPGKEKQRYKKHETHKYMGLERDEDIYWQQNVKQHFTTQQHQKTWNTNTHNKVHSQSSEHTSTDTQEADHQVENLSGANLKSSSHMSMFYQPKDTQRSRSPKLIKTTPPTHPQ